MKTCETCKNKGNDDIPWDCPTCTPDKSNWEPIGSIKVDSEENPPLDCVGIFSLNGYQIAAMRTAGMENKICRYGNFALGIAGEAGEVADYIKKVLYHGHPIDKDKLCKELGDVLWYVATLADTAGLTLEVVARANIDKLWARYPNGFSTERSINRDIEPMKREEIV